MSCSLSEALQREGYIGRPWAGGGCLSKPPSQTIMWPPPPTGGVGRTRRGWRGVVGGGRCRKACCGKPAGIPGWGGEVQPSPARELIQQLLHQDCF